MNFIVAQILGIVVTVCELSATQFRTVKAALFMEVVTNLLCALNYLLLGGVSGAWVCMVAMIQAVIMFFMDQYKKEDTEIFRRVCLIVFCLIYIVGTVVTFENAIDIIPCLCALILSCAICQKDILRYKTIYMFNPAIWIAYDILTKAYTTVLLHVILIVGNAITVVRILHNERRTASRQADN